MDQKVEDDNEALLLLASQLNSDLNSKQTKLLDRIQITNSAMKALGTEEMLIAVGSCLDGSKVNTPRDSGDVDVLIVSGNVELSENLFRYVPGYPAFLTIPITGEHLQMFRNVEPAGDNCLPASTLQEMKNDYFSMVKFVMTSNFLPKGAGDKMRLVKRSKVGLETTEVSGVLSDPGGVLELPKQTLSRGEGVFNVLTCMNEAVDVLKYELPKLNKTGMKVKSTEYETQNDGSKPTKYQNVGDIHVFYLLGNTINKIKKITDTDGDESDKCCLEATERATSLDNDEQDSPRNEVKETKEKHDDHNDISALHTSQTDKSSISDKRCTKTNIKEHTEIDKLVDKDGEQYGASASFIHKKERPDTEDESTAVDYDLIQSADYVPAFKFTCWPRVAEEWMHRERKWPSSGVIEEVLKTACQVIVKPLPHKVKDDGSYTPTGNDNTFRLSFASQELILARSLNKTQITCWKILKAFQKSFFEITPRVMTSYLWKNALFWISEVEESLFWKPENTLCGTIKVLDFALECLKNGAFPQYFVKDMNLIKHCCVDAVEKAIAKIVMLKRGPISHLRHFIEYPPESQSLKVTSTDIQNLLKSKDKNYEFGFVKSELLNTFNRTLKGMESDEEDAAHRRGSQLREGSLDVIEQMKSIHEKRQTGITDEKHVLLGNFFDSFKELFSTVSDPDQTKSTGDFGIPSKFQKTVSSMLSLVLHKEGQKEQTQKSEGQKSSPYTEMKMDDLDLD